MSSRPEIIVYRSDFFGCLFASLDHGVSLLDLGDALENDEVYYWKPSRVPDLREVWRSGPES